MSSEETDQMREPRPSPMVFRMGTVKKFPRRDMTMKL